MSEKYQIVFPVAVGWPRLANQMFQYAVAHLFALQTNSKVVLDIARLNSGMFSFHKYFKNLDFVTESFTLIAGIGNVPFCIRSYRR